MKELTFLKKRYDTPRLTVLLRSEFGAINHKRNERIYSQESPSLPRKRKKKRGLGESPRALSQQVLTSAGVWTLFTIALIALESSEC